jgi:NAD(P)-dependent dehydrogenase (short-subunit alcohol dehydrogenase family)
MSRSTDARVEFPAGAALVIGGSGGVGRAIVSGLAERGSNVVVAYRKSAAPAEEAAQLVRGMGLRAEAVRLALDDEHVPLEPLLSELRERVGPLHTVINAAGADIAMKFVSQIDEQAFRAVLEADVQGFFRLVRAAIPHLRTSQGSIVAVTSAGLRRYPTRDILSVAPKAAIEALVRAVAVEEGRYGVRANSVAVGVVEAGLFHRLQGRDQGQGLSEEWVAAAKRNTPLRRFGTAEEVADAVVFLASSRARYITGQSLAVDGGYAL